VAAIEWEQTAHPPNFDAMLVRPDGYVA